MGVDGDEGSGGPERVKIDGPSVVLDGFGRIGFFRGEGNPEDHMLPAVVRSVAEYLGHDCGLPGFSEENRGPWRWQTCALVHGVSGQAFHHSWGHWGPQRPIWGPDLMAMYVESFGAAGLACRPVLKPAFAEGLGWNGAVSDDEEEYRRLVVESIRNGTPVVGLQLFGPPEPGVITGLSEDGAAIVGWDHFQDEAKGDARVSFDEAGRFVKRDWIQDIAGIILVTGSAPRPDARTLYQHALTRDLRQMVIPGTETEPLGFAAFHAWARDLLDDGRHTGADEGVLKEHHGQQHGVVGEVAERRAYGHAFLDQAAAALPEVGDDLSRAAECFGLMHDLCWRAWQTGGDTHRPTDSTAMRLADPATRRELAAIVLAHRDLDLRAASLIRRALVGVGVPEAELPELPGREAFDGVRQLPYVAADPDQPVMSSDLETHEAPRNGSYLRGAPPYLGFGERVCSFAGAMETALAATARPYSYADLMGHSGLAFRTRWFHNPDHQETPYGDQPWHPVSPHGEQPDVLERLSVATGWQFRMEVFDPSEVLRHEQLTTDLVLSVFSGAPVVVGYRTDMGVAHGYHIWSMSYLLRHQQAPDETPLRVKYVDEGIHGPFIYLEESREPSSEIEGFAAGLRLAIWNHRERQSEGAFLFGESALAAWREAVESWDTLSPSDRELLFQVNWWTLLHLWDARQAAVAYLQGQRELIDGSAQQNLDAAIESYTRETELLHQFLQEHAELVAWWGGKGGVSAWEPQVRHNQIDLMERATGLETRAVASLEAALGNL